MGNERKAPRRVAIGSGAGRLDLAASGSAPRTTGAPDRCKPPFQVIAKRWVKKEAFWLVRFSDGSEREINTATLLSMRFRREVLAVAGIDRKTVTTSQWTAWLNEAVAPVREARLRGGSA